MTGTKPSNGIDLQRAKLELDQYGFTMLPTCSLATQPWKWRRS